MKKESGAHLAATQFTWSLSRVRQAGAQVNSGNVRRAQVNVSRRRFICWLISSARRSAQIERDQTVKIFIVRRVVHLGSCIVVVVVAPMETIKSQVSRSVMAR